MCPGAFALFLAERRRQRRGKAGGALADAQQAREPDRPGQPLGLFRFATVKVNLTGTSTVDPDALS
jgi:hypothetical protein